MYSDCRIWLTAQPKSKAAIGLRNIISQLHLIKNRDQWGIGFSLIKWQAKHYNYLNEKTFNAEGKYWYKHKLLRRSFSVIKKALPNLFHYLDNVRIPKSTNGLEAFFGHLRNHITIHGDCQSRTDGSLFNGIYTSKTNEFLKPYPLTIKIKMALL
jgi:hypothetical protein